MSEQASIFRGVVAFWRWWRRELGALAPARHRRPRRRAAEVADDGSLRVVEAGVARSPAAVEVTAAELARLRPGFGLRLAPADVLIRTLSLPPEAVDRVADVLRLDTARATPFSEVDIAWDYLIEDAPGANGDILVTQAIARRASIDRAVAVAAAAGLRPAFVDCWTHDGSRGLDVDFLAPRAVARARPTEGGFVRALAASALVLALGVGALAIERQERALEGIRTEVAIARVAAGKATAELVAARLRLSAGQALKALKGAKPSTVEIIEEMSRTLPDGTHLQTLRIENGGLQMSGIATSAASLVQTIEASPMFEDAALTAPVTLDETEGGERFAMRTQLARTRVARVAP